jgi:ERCC4-related helicase
MRVAHLVGHGTSGRRDDNGEKTRMSVSRQKAVIREIWNGSYSIVVATAVDEEGIYLPECDLVVRIGAVDCVRA